MTARWQALQRRHAWLRHVLSAYALLQRNHGNEYAAAITYFSFLALFPLLLLAVAVTGFVLHAHPAAQQALFAHISDNVPGDFGKTLATSLKTAIADRTGVGLVGLFGVLLTGLGWIGNLREAINAVWGLAPARKNFLMARVGNLLVLGGLGVGVLISLGLTAVGTAVTDQVLSALSLQSLPGFRYLFKVLGIAIAVAGDMVIFWWLLVRLPQVEVPGRIALKGALLASVGFEVLKIVGTYTIRHTADSTSTVGPFASVIAVLVWIQLVARYQLFSCAWIATLNASVLDELAPVADPAAIQAGVTAAAAASSAASSVDDVSVVHPATVAAALVGTGAAAGVAATVAVQRGRRRRRE